MLKGHFKKIWEEIVEAQSIVIFHHIRPDGDCLGAQEGLYQLIKANFINKAVHKIGNPLNTLKFMNWEIKSELDANLNYDCAIIVDANKTERIENRDFLKNHFQKILRIDHHPTEDDLDEFAPKVIRWVDSSFAASSEQIAFMAKELNLKMTKRGAEALYLGILTDGGHYKYAAAGANTLEAGAYLLKNGADKTFLINNLEKRNLQDLLLQKLIIKNTRISEKIIYYTITREEAQNLNLEPQQVVRVNTLANIDDFFVWMSFTEEANQKIRVEYRSKGPNVSLVAQKFGGGGHLHASGSIIEGNLRNSQQKINEILAFANQTIKEWENGS